MLAVSSSWLLIFPENVNGASKPPVKNIQIEEKNSKEEGIYHNSQSNTTIEFGRNQFLLRDLDDQTQHTLEKDQTVLSKNGKRKMVSYRDRLNPDFSHLYDKKHQEVIYNNAVFKKMNTKNQKQVLNVNSAINLIKDKHSNNGEKLIYSGSNTRQLDENGRLFYKIIVRDQSHAIKGTYKVFVENGRVRK